MKMLDETLKGVNEIKNPQTRLNILMPIAAAVVLFAFCVRLFFMLIHSDGSNTLELKQRIQQLERDKAVIAISWERKFEEARDKVDSIQALRYAESQARINEYKAMLKIADNVKTTIEKLKATRWEY